MSSHNSHTLIACLGFVIAAIAAASLLLFAFVVWFAEVVNSYPLALTLTGLILGGIAAVVYLLSIRPVVNDLNEQIETIYQVAKSAQSGYLWLLERANMLFNLFKS